jgi:hypothetical protein
LLSAVCKLGELAILHAPLEEDAVSRPRPFTPSRRRAWYRPFVLCHRSQTLNWECRCPR